MRNIGFSLLWSAALLSACASVPVEGLITHESPPGWHVGFQRDHGKGRGYIREFIPKDERIESWRHLATIQFVEGDRRTPKEFMAGLEQSIKATCASAIWNVLTEDPYSVFYEWQIQGCSGQEDQVEISRLVQGNDGLHRIAYTEKGKSMDPEAKAYWSNVLLKAYVAKGSPENRIH